MIFLQLMLALNLLPIPSFAAGGNTGFNPACRKGTELLVESTPSKIVVPTSHFIDPRVVRSDIAPSVETLFTAGPFHWVKLPHEPQGRDYLRGTSGGYPNSQNGVQEVADLFSGKPDKFTRWIWVDEAAHWDHSADYSSAYALPLMVRGKIPEHRLPIDEDFPDRSPLEGHLIDDVSQMALIPPAGKLESPEPMHRWAKSYLELYQRLAAAGMQIDPVSRGGRFHIEIEAAMIGVPEPLPRRRWTSPEIEQDPVVKVIRRFRAPSPK